MSQKALGMVETKGILAAYEAADVALKSANVKMVGYEISRGGLVVIKFTGDVSAVRSAVDAAKAAASQLSKVWFSHVIARPAKEIESMINSEDTVNRKNEETKKDETAEDNNLEKQFEDDEITKNNNIKAEDDEEDKSNNDYDDENESDTLKEVKDDLSEPEADKYDEDELTIESETEEKEEDICNLCGDPACPRTKGDLHKDCIHYDEIIDDE